MAKDKKSFVLYADLIKSLDHLTNEELGVLFRHLFEYVNDKKPTLTDRLLLTAWKPIELQLKRDLIKFEEVKAKRSEAGKRSAELRALKSEEQNSTNSTSVESVQQSSTNSTVNDTDNVNVNESDIKKELSLANINPKLNNLNAKEISNLMLQSEELKNTFEYYYPQFNYKESLVKFYNHKLSGGALIDSFDNYSKHFFNWIKKNK